MIWSAQELLFGGYLRLDQWVDKPDALLVGGGTFLPKTPLDPNLVRRSRELPTAIFATGVDDPRFWGTDSIAQWLEVIANCEFVGVRGPLSIEWLASWGASCEKVEWVGDAALAFASVECDRPPFRGRVAVNLGKTFGRIYGDEEHVIDVTIQALRTIVNRGWEVSLVCAWEPDDEVLSQLDEAVPVRRILHWHDNWQRALEDVSDFDLVLAEKLHVSVVAACKGIPFVALAYRSKVTDFCQSLAWSNFCLSTEALDPEQVVDRLDHLAADVPTQSFKLSEQVADAKNRLLGAVPRVLEALRGAE